MYADEQHTHKTAVGALHTNVCAYLHMCVLYVYTVEGGCGDIQTPLGAQYGGREGGYADIRQTVNM